MNHFNIEVPIYVQERLTWQHFVDLAGSMAFRKVKSERMTLL